MHSIEERMRQGSCITGYVLYMYAQLMNRCDEQMNVCILIDSHFYSVSALYAALIFPLNILFFILLC